MISDRKRLIGIHAAAFLLSLLSSRSSWAQDTVASHIYRSPFGSLGVTDLASAADNTELVAKRVATACESLRTLHEQSGTYHDQLDCVVVRFRTTDFAPQLSDDRLSIKHTDTLVELDAPRIADPHAVHVSGKVDPFWTDREPRQGADELPAPTNRLSSGDDGRLPPSHLEDALSSYPANRISSPAETKILGLDKNLVPPFDTQTPIESTGYWSNLLDCKHKDKVKTVAGDSSEIFIGSNLMTIASARTDLLGYGANNYVARMAAPRMLRVARSAPWKIGLAAVALASSAVEAYQLFHCE